MSSIVNSIPPALTAAVWGLCLVLVGVLSFLAGRYSRRRKDGPAPLSVDLPVAEETVDAYDAEKSPEAEVEAAEADSPAEIWDVPSAAPAGKGRMVVADPNLDLMSLIDKYMGAVYDVQPVSTVSDLRESVKDGCDTVLVDAEIAGARGTGLVPVLKELLEASPARVVVTVREPLVPLLLPSMPKGVNVLRKPYSLESLRGYLSGEWPESGPKSLEAGMYDLSDSYFGMESDAFVKGAVDTIIAHIAESDYTQANFARDMGLSKTTLFRKFKNSLGLSYFPFERTVRVKEACRRLARNPGIPISELAYLVGFVDVKNFSGNFRNVVGFSPREYKKAFLK